MVKTLCEGSKKCSWSEAQLRAVAGQLGAAHEWSRTGKKHLGWEPQPARGGEEKGRAAGGRRCRRGCGPARRSRTCHPGAPLRLAGAAVLPRGHAVLPCCHAVRQFVAQQTGRVCRCCRPSSPPPALMLQSSWVDAAAGVRQQDAAPGGCRAAPCCFSGAVQAARVAVLRCGQLPSSTAPCLAAPLSPRCCHGRATR